MLEKMSFTLWDIGAYLIIGFYSTVVIFSYCFATNYLSPEIFLEESKNHSSLLIILTPIIFLSLGMIIEPIANWTNKQLEKINIFKPAGSRKKDNLLSLIAKKLDNPDITSINTYKYCKAVLELKNPNSNHEIFLARFGFYRSLSFIFMTLPIINLFALSLSAKSLAISIFFAFMFYQCFRRAQLYKVHLEESVYFNYLALYEKNDNKQKGD